MDRWCCGSDGGQPDGAGLVPPRRGEDRALAASLFLICWLAFVGTVLHVKSTIRERDDVRFRRASIGFHTVAAVIAAAIDPVLLVPFGFLLARAVLVPRHGWRPARIGAVEIVGALLVLIVPLLVVGSQQ